MKRSPATARSRPPGNRPGSKRGQAPWCAAPSGPLGQRVLTPFGPTRRWPPHGCTPRGSTETAPMCYSLATLWHERNRFLPGVLAVAFSALLIALQGGLLLGLFSITSLPIDHSSADLWVGNPEVLSVDLGRTIPEAWV